MVERDLGQATIVYEDRDGQPEEKTVQNEHIAYFQDHWIVKTGEHERQDVVRRIPAHRVYHVERSVERFEQEITTLRDQIQSVADDVRSKLMGGGGRRRQPTGTRRSERSEGHRVDVEGQEPKQRSNGSG